MKILLAKGQSQYEGTRYFMDQAAQALIEKGHQVFMLDLTMIQVTFGDIVEAVRSRGPFDLIFTANYLAEAQDAAGRYLSDILDAPHIVWHTDYVLTQQAVIENTSRHTPILVVDPTQIDALTSIYGAERFDHLGFFAHPAVGEPSAREASVTQFVDNRPIQILWSGTFHKPQGLAWKDAPRPTKQLFDHAFELCLSKEWIAPHEALDQVLSSLGADLADPGLQSARKAAWLVDQEVRIWRRFEFVKQTAATGLPLHICGAGWESELYRFKNAHYAGAVSMSRMVELMKQSRIVLNTNGNFGGGSHERPFTALNCGAACFSDFSTYYGEVFVEDRDIAFYSWKSLGADIAKLADLHADSERCLRMAQSGQSIVAANHTWPKRIEVILDLGRGLPRPSQRPAA